MQLTGVIEVAHLLTKFMLHKKFEGTSLLIAIIPILLVQLVYTYTCSIHCTLNLLEQCNERIDILDGRSKVVAHLYLYKRHIIGSEVDLCTVIG